jgi:hypothetical protein
VLAVRDIHRRLNDVACGHRVVFHHVPKCGGTSVSRALHYRYPTSYVGFPSQPTYGAIEALNPGKSLEEIIESVISFREMQLLYYLHSDVRCIAGHVRFSNTAYENFNSNYRFITTLREPVSMLVSLFFYDLNSNDQRWKFGSSIEAFLETPRAAMFGSAYAHFFSGLPGADSQSPEVIDRAKSNLAKFAAIGFMDDMQGFQRRLRDVLGVRLRIGHDNRARVDSAERGRVVTDAVRRKIEALSAINLEIYEHARRHPAS